MEGKGKEKYVYLRTKLRAFMKLTTPSEEEGGWASKHYAYGKATRGSRIQQANNGKNRKRPSSSRAECRVAETERPGEFILSKGGGETSGGKKS